MKTAIERAREVTRTVGRRVGEEDKRVLRQRLLTERFAGLEDSCPLGELTLASIGRLRLPPSVRLELARRRAQEIHGWRP